MSPRIPVEQYDKAGTLLLVHESLHAAAASLQIKGAQGNIAACCKNRLKSAYGFVWKYQTQDAEDLPGEDWVKYKDAMVSSLGRVKKHDELRGWTLQAPGSSSNDRYPRLSVGGRLQPLHRVVFLAFRGDPGDGVKVFFRDGNPENARLDNLTLDKSQQTRDMAPAFQQCPRMFPAKVREIKAAALKRKYSYELEDGVAMDLLKAACAYCATSPAVGIDRADNSLGYTLANSVPACSACNLMKGCMDARTFVQRCMHVCGERDCPDVLRDSWSGGLGDYRYEATKRDLAFEISELQFKMLQAADCSYCGKQSSATHQNGMDRLDSRQGYVLDNVVPCCSDCNMSKRAMSAEDFVERCRAVAVQWRDKDLPPESGPQVLARKLDFSRPSAKRVARRRVQQVNAQTGKVEAEFDTPQLASVGVTGDKDGRRNIKNACDGAAKSAYGYAWRWASA